MGIVFAVKYDEVTELRADYYITCPTLSSSCTFTIDVPKKIPGPIYLFIEMKNFKQNVQAYLDNYDPK